MIYGVALDFCNRKVIGGLLARDQRGIVVVTDATKPIYPESVEELMSRWQAQGVIMRTTDEILGELEALGVAAFQPQVALQRQSF